MSLLLSLVRMTSGSSVVCSMSVMFWRHGRLDRKLFSECCRLTQKLMYIANITITLTKYVSQTLTRMVSWNGRILIWPDK